VPAAEAWAVIQRDCDAVWLPYPNPAGEMERLYRHHFPSKLPEYLALGLPVLVTGPAYATGVRWARENPQAAAAAAGDDENELVNVFARLSGDDAWREQLAAHGWAAGLRDFDPVKIRETFHGYLRSAAGT
jgi:glycosyltransferase involved in cell wall biosynthesis